MFEKLNNAFTMWVGIISIIAGGIYTMEGRYAHAQDTVDIKEAFSSKIDKVETKLDFKVTSDELYQTRERKWKLQDRLEKNPTDDSLKADIRELEASESELKAAIENIQTKSNFVLH